MHDIIMLVTGMFIGLFTACCIAAWAIQLDYRSKNSDKLVKKFAWATGISEDAAREILEK